MQYIAPILQAFVALGWLVFAFTVLFIFQEEFRAAFARVKKGKVFGQEFELKDEIQKLETSANAAVQETERLPPEEKSKPTIEGETELSAFERSVLKQAAADPKLALMMLSAEIERRARQALAARGVLANRGAVSLTQALLELQRYGFPEQLLVSLKSFSAVRSKIVHGSHADHDDVLQAIDSGLKILRALSVMPGERNVVYRTDIDLFSNENCTVSVSDAKGVALERISSSGERDMRIFPTTKTHFQTGQEVAWEWNMAKVWGQTWCRDPQTRQIKRAWVSSAEFIGRHLEDI